MKNIISKKVKIFFYAVLILTVFFLTGLLSETVKAAQVKVPVDNNASGNTEINLEDFITFVPKGATGQKYKYYYNAFENGDILYQFGNGKFWAAKPGTATVIISGLDKNGKFSFIADYRVIVGKEKSRIKILSPAASEGDPDISSDSAVTPNPPAATGGAINGRRYQIYPDMSDVTLGVTDLNGKYIRKGVYDKELTSFTVPVNSSVILGESVNSDISGNSSNPNMKFGLSLENNQLKVDIYGIGATVITVEINNKTFVLNVNITEDGLSKTTLLLAEGESYGLKLNGIDGSQAVWQSLNPDIVNVDMTGKVTALKKGNTVIKVIAGGKTLGCAVSVTTDIRKKAVEYARSYSAASVYSQSKRMLEGFYDCSSLVWRAYNKFGINLLESVYAPTAEAMGQHFYERNQIIQEGITSENTRAMVFEPGDLFFLQGAGNGRFMNIYHVEMVSGYIFKGFDASGNPILGVEFANRQQGNVKGFVGRPQI